MASYRYARKLASSSSVVTASVLLAAALAPARASARPGGSAALAAASAARTVAARPTAHRGPQQAGPVAVHGTPVPLASAPQIPVGSGPVLNGTFVKFSISDRVSLQVNVGSGDALLTTTDITIPEVGSSLTLGTSYNSLLTGSGVAVSSNGDGWRSREGADVQLYPADDGSVTFLGEDGTAGKFTLQSGSTTMYNSLASSTSRCRRTSQARAGAPGGR